MNTKAEYVRSQGQTRSHHCHWPGCEKQVPPAMWGCRSHWFALPANLRARIWATYKPGQEVNGTPSAAYIEAANAAQSWIKGQCADDQAWDRNADKLTRDAFGPDVDRPINPQATCVDDL